VTKHQLCFVLYCVSVVAATPRLSAQVGSDSLTSRERGLFISSVIRARVDRLRDSTRMDGCSLQRAFPEHTEVLPLIREQEREFIDASIGYQCKSLTGKSRSVHLLSIEPSGAGNDFRVVVRIRVGYGPRRYEDESYLFRIPEYLRHFPRDSLWRPSLIELFHSIQLP
jgi:hypothetical protein